MLKEHKTKNGVKVTIALPMTKNLWEAINETVPKFYSAQLFSFSDSYDMSEAEYYVAVYSIVSRGEQLKQVFRYYMEKNILTEVSPYLYEELRPLLN